MSSPTTWTVAQSMERFWRRAPAARARSSRSTVEDLCVAAISGIKCMYLVSSLGFRLGDYSTGHSCEHLLCNPLLILYVVGQICISQLTPPPKACGDFGEGREVPHSSGHGVFSPHHFLTSQDKLKKTLISPTMPMPIPETLYPKP